MCSLLAADHTNNCIYSGNYPSPVIGQAMEPLPADASEARPHGAAHCPGAARSEGLVMLERPDGIAMLEGLQQLVAEVREVKSISITINSISIISTSQLFDHY